MSEPNVNDGIGTDSTQPSEGLPHTQDSGTQDSGTQDSGTQDSAKHDSDSRDFRIGNVLGVVLPLLVLGAGAIAFFGFFDGTNWLSRQMNPPLVMAKGKVMYHGKPLHGAQISTRHSNHNLTNSIGWTDEQGRFTLRTDIDGYIDGAYAGEHQVLVTAREIINAPTAPPLITPAKYASFETTPLRIVVSRVAEENEYVLNLEGDPPERPNANRAGGGFNPETIVGRVFDTYDTDDDDQLSGEEMQAIEGDRGDRIRQADANEDGIVERDELMQAMAPPE